MYKANLHLTKSHITRCCFADYTVYGGGQNNKSAKKKFCTEPSSELFKFKLVFTFSRVEAIKKDHSTFKNKSQEGDDISKIITIFANIRNYFAFPWL